MEFRGCPEWLEIYDTNSAYFSYALDEFAADYNTKISIFIARTGLSCYISEQRVDEMHRACADDLYRYATYHPVNKNGGVFEIAEPIRASYMTKWLLMFKPLFLDSMDSFFLQNLKVAESNSIPYEVLDFFRKSNECLALYLATQVIRIDPQLIDGKCFIKFVSEVLCGNGDQNSSEIKDLMYSMRYRIPHQDIYRALYRRLDACG